MSDRTPLEQSGGARRQVLVVVVVEERGGGGEEREEVLASHGLGHTQTTQTQHSVVWPTQTHHHQHIPQTQNSLSTFKIGLTAVELDQRSKHYV